MLQELDTEVVVATARDANTNATAVSANLVVDERQMNALFLDVVSSHLLIHSSKMKMKFNGQCFFSAAKNKKFCWWREENT